ALAEETVATRDRERDDDAVAAFEFLIARSDFDHFAHELVPQDVSRLHRGNVAVEQVEIRAADRGRRDAHDRVTRVQDLRIGDALDADIVLAMPNQRFHATPQS